MKIVLNAARVDRDIVQIVKRVRKAVGKKHQLYATSPLAGRVGLPRSSMAGDVIFAIGGDGTVLGTERLLRKATPILGIHKGTVGFLSEIDVEDIEVAVSRFLRKKYHVEERIKLQAVLNGKNLAAGLNEVAVMSERAAGICKLRVRIDGNLYKTFDADGVIVATPTGSTAYSLSAGGPIIVPETQTFIVVPVCPYTTAARPLVVPDTSRIEIQVLEGTTIVAIDGQDRRRFKKGKLVIRKHRRKAKLVRFGESFYRQLEKLAR